MDDEEAARHCQPPSPGKGKTWGGLGFWGVAVKPGETLNCDSGELYIHLSQIALEIEEEKGVKSQEGVEAEEGVKTKENKKQKEKKKEIENVEVFLKIDGESIMLGTLSVDKDPHFATNVVLKKKFELLHFSKTNNICFTGYKFNVMDRDETSKGGDEIDEEVPVPLDSSTDDYKNYEATHDANKLTAPKPVDAPSLETKATVEEPTRPGNLMGDDKEKTDAQNPGDGDDSESSENVDYPLKKTKGKRLLETLLNTPEQKKAKIETPTTGPYPAKQDRKTSDYVHVPTPHPVKRATKASISKDKSSNQSTPHICSSCGRSFSSLMGLKDHSKVKHGAPQ